MLRLLQAVGVGGSVLRPDGADVDPICAPAATILGLLQTLPTGPSTRTALSDLCWLALSAL